MTAVRHPRQPARRGGSRSTSWWGKAWNRAVDEAAYAEEELRRGRRLARAGSVGQIGVDAGSLWASVEGERGPWTVTVAVPVLDDASRDAFVETVAAEAGRIAALLAGELPHALVEHAEEAGVELLPYGGELAAACTCEPWVDPCEHALAVLHQVGWLVDRDPFVLLHLRGLSREELLAALHARTVAAPTAGMPDGTADDEATEAEETTLELALEATLRARRLLAELDGLDESTPRPAAP